MVHFLNVSKDKRQSAAYSASRQTATPITSASISAATATHIPSEDVTQGKIDKPLIRNANRLIQENGKDAFCDPEVTPEDAVIFAPYQPQSGRQYDLTNVFDRTNISRPIREAIDRRQDYIALITRLFRAGLMPRSEYLELTDIAAAQLQQHREALWRLNEIGRY